MDGVAQVAALGPRTRKGHVIVGHGEFAVIINRHIARSPTVEGIAIQRGLLGHGYGGVVLHSRFDRQLRRASRHITVVLVRNFMLVQLPIAPQMDILPGHCELVVDNGNVVRRPALKGITSYCFGNRSSYLIIIRLRLSARGCYAIRHITRILIADFEDVLLIVYLDDVLRFNRADGQREILCLIKVIAGGALVSIPSYLAVEVRFVRFGQAVVLRTVNVVFNSVAVLIDGIIEDNLLIIRIQLEGLGCGINCGVTGHVDGFLGHGAVKGLAANNLIFLHLLRGALFVVVHGVGNVGVRLPDGIKDVLALAVYLHHISASFDGAAAVGRGIPAHESIANAGEGVFDGGNGGVVGDGVNRLFRFRAIIGHIGQGDGCGTSAPHASEGHVVLDLILVAGLVDSISAIFPTEEVLSIVRNQLGRSHEVGKAVIRVLLGIRRSVYARDVNVLISYNISNGEGAVLGVVGIEGDVAVNLGVNVEGLTGAVRAGAPAAPRIARVVRHDLRLKIIQLISNRATVFNVLDGFGRAANNSLEHLTSKGRFRPLSIEGNVPRRHGLAGKVISRTSTKFIIIPTAKGIVLLANRRGRCIAYALNILFVLLRNGLVRCTAIYENDVVAVAGVVEFGVVVA